MFGPVDPGLLLAAGDRVSFVTRKGPVFEADRAEMQVKWPRSEFGGGVHLVVGGKTYRLSLARPPHAPDVDEQMAKSLREAALSLSGWGELFEAGAGIRDIFAARGSGKEWKAYFAAP